MLTPSPVLTKLDGMKLSIIGSGVVGRATGTGLKAMGNSPTFFDISSAVQADLKNQGLVVADSVEKAVDDSDLIMVCVPTPTIAGQMSLDHVLSACILVGEALRDLNGYKVVVIRSTVLPLSTRNEVLPILEKRSRKKAGRDFGICVNPEFLRDRSALSDFLSPDRIVIGELDPQSGNLLEALYRPFGKPIVRCSLEEAELVKYVCNAFLATKISFFNEIFNVCQKIAVNPKVVAHAASLDHRIGEYGVVGGRPFDGPCLPKDLEALITFVKRRGENPKILQATVEINKQFS